MKLTREQLAWFKVCFYDMAEQHGWTRDDAAGMYRTWVTFTRRPHRAGWRNLPVLSSRVKHRAKKAPQNAAPGEATSRVTPEDREALGKLVAGWPILDRSSAR